MKISLERLRRQAEATGFRPEVLEKVIHLLNLLEALRSHSFVKDRSVPGAGAEPAQCCHRGILRRNGNFLTTTNQLLTVLAHLKTDVNRL